MANLDLKRVDLVVVDRDQPLQLNSDLDQKIGERIAKIPGVKAVDFGLSDYITVPKGAAGKGEGGADRCPRLGAEQLHL